MATITTTKYICDRCGHESNDKNDTRACESGHVNIIYRGDKGGKAYDGAWGGVSIAGEKWLCLDCTKEFEKFLRKPVPHLNI